MEDNVARLQMLYSERLGAVVWEHGPLMARVNPVAQFRVLGASLNSRTLVDGEVVRITVLLPPFKERVIVGVAHDGFDVDVIGNTMDLVPSANTDAGRTEGAKDSQQDSGVQAGDAADASAGAGDAAG